MEILRPQTLIALQLEHLGTIDVELAALAEYYGQPTEAVSDQPSPVDPRQNRKHLSPQMLQIIAQANTEQPVIIAAPSIDPQKDWVDKSDESVQQDTETKSAYAVVQEQRKTNTAPDISYKFFRKQLENGQLWQFKLNYADLHDPQMPRKIENFMKFIANHLGQISLRSANSFKVIMYDFSSGQPVFYSDLGKVQGMELPSDTACLESIVDKIKNSQEPIIVEAKFSNLYQYGPIDQEDQAA